MSDEVIEIIEREQAKKNKKITIEQLETIANKYDIPLACLRAVLEVECRGNGFTVTGEPTILFEPHIFYKRLTAHGKSELRDKLVKDEPSLCYAKWKLGNYGSYNSQHIKLQKAVKYDRVSALESCSWGLGQVMGYHWKSLGYSSLQEFINLVYRDELGQLEVMIKYLEVNNLLNALCKRDWDKFALGYNGKGYKAHHYDINLKKAYDKFNTNT